MKFFRQKAVFAVVLLCLTVFTTKYSYAANKTITSINVKVKSDISIGSYTDSLNVNHGSESGGDINVYTVSDKFSITNVDVVNTRVALNIGDKVRIRVRLEPAAGYTFKGTYSSSNISINGGTYLSSSKSRGDLIVDINLNPVKGTYDAPIEPVWKDNGIGFATWEEPSQSSGYYELVLMRGSTQVTKVENYKGNGYDFRKSMNKKGTYKFRIRTVAHESKEKEYGKNSEWVTSDEFYMDEAHISDNPSGPSPGPSNSTSPSSPGASSKSPSSPGSDSKNQSSPGSDSKNGSSQSSTNPTNSSNKTDYKVGWNKDGDNWYFKFPDGSLKTNGWEYIIDNWYLFDNAGKMLTGWQQSGGEYYYLDSSGHMMTGWQKVDNKWYYLNVEEPKGKMVSNIWLKSTDDKYYYMGGNGALSEGWTQINGKWYYFYSDSGQMAVNTVIDSFKLGADGAWER